MRLSRHPGLVLLTSLALFVAGVGEVLYGFGMLRHGLLESTVLPVGAGALLLAASITLARAAERQLHAEEKRAVEEPSPAPARVAPSRTPAAAHDAVLARWTLEPYEWLAFNHQEADARRRSAFGTMPLAAVPGAMAAYVVTDNWRHSAAGAALAGAAALVATLVSAARLRRREPRDATVIVRRNRVEVDGTVEVLCDGERWVSGAKLRDDLPLPIIELKVMRLRDVRGSRRTVERVVRVPVPRGREADARRIADELARGIVDDREEG